MPRGGARKNAGRKSLWTSGCAFKDTQTIRVPKAIAPKVLEYARKLDREKFLEIETNTKVVSKKVKTELPMATENAELFSVDDFDGAPPVPPGGGMTRDSLGKRLGVTAVTVRRTGDKKRHVPNGFQDWSRERDPEGIAWQYDPGSKLYFPV